LELDNFKGHYIVAGRRKQNALKDLVTEGKLYTKGRTKTYLIAPREDTGIEENADTEMEENVDTGIEENKDTG
jgi:DNA-binding transcriptional regulator YhcF (GntR family)